jgi:hypothetical protein
MYSANCAAALPVAQALAILHDHAGFWGIGA